MKALEKWTEVPRPVKLFLLKAIALFVLWKGLYLLVLLPGRVLDKPLTYAVGVSTAATLNVISPPGDYSAREGLNPKQVGNTIVQEDVMQIFLSQQRLLSIGDPCNGLEILVLYAGLILCLPGSAYKKAMFLVLGMVCIEVLNVIRCAALVLIYIHRPEYLDFSHHYLFTFLVYAFIFWLWFRFTKGLGFAKKLPLHASGG